MDQVLESFLASTDEQESKEQLGELLARHAAPLVRRSSRAGWATLRRHRRRVLAGDAAADAAPAPGKGDAKPREHRRVRELRRTAAHHGCDHYVRGKYPLDGACAIRIRYVLEHDARFAVWNAADGSWICGCHASRATLSGGARDHEPSDGVPHANRASCSSTSGFGCAGAIEADIPRT